MTIKASINHQLTYGQWTVFLYVCFGWPMPAVTPAQLFDATSLVRIEFSMSVGANGELRKYPAVLAGCVSEQELELLDRDSKLIELLKLSVDQEKSFKQLGQRYRRQLADKYPGPIQSKVLVDEARVYLRQVQSDLRLILNSTQQAELIAATRRLRLRLFGLNRSLRFASSHFELSREQRGRLRECLETQTLDLREQQRAFQESHLQEIVKILAAEQLRVWEQEFRSSAESQKVPFEVLALQLSLTGEEDFLKHTRSKSLDALHLPSAFTLDPSGRLQFSWSPEMSGVMTSFAKLGLLRDVTLSARLDLSETQVQELGELANRLQRDYHRIMKRRPLPVATVDQTAAEHQLESERSLEKMKRYTAEVIDPFQRSVDKQIEDLLIPKQQTLLNDVVLQVEIRRLGLATALVHGKLGSRFKVTDRQKAWLLKFREQQLKELLVIMREMETQILSEVREIAGAEREQSLTEIFGEDVEAIRPCPNMLLGDPVLDF
jgi:hypothetical protein